jgi:hypothetical protein
LFVGAKEKNEMQTFWIETIISQNGILTIRGLPFRTGEKVEVIVLRSHHKREGDERYPLRGKPIRYIAPFESVAENDWDVLR